MPTLGIGFCRATLGIKHLTARFQPQRFMIAPAAVGDSATCPRRPCLFVRRCRPKESKPASLASPSSRVLPLASAAFLLARNTRSLKFIEERQCFSFLVPFQADPRELQVGEVPIRGELEIMLPGDLRLFPIGVRHPIKRFRVSASVFEIHRCEPARFTKFEKRRVATIPQNRSSRPQSNHGGGRIRRSRGRNDNRGLLLSERT